GRCQRAPLIDARQEGAPRLAESSGLVRDRAVDDRAGGCHVEEPGVVMETRRRERLGQIRLKALELRGQLLPALMIGAEGDLVLDRYAAKVVPARRLISRVERAGLAARGDLDLALEDRDPRTGHAVV